MNLTQIRTKAKELEAKFDTLYDDTIDLIPVSNKKLKDALADQIDLQLQWGTLSKSISHVYDMCEVEVESEYAGSVSKELRDSYKTTTITEAKEYAKASKEYQEAKRVLVDLKLLRDNAREVYEVVNSRKYVLNNITAAVVASMENHII